MSTETTAGRARPLVLCADDEADCLDYAAFCVRRAGFDVATAIDGDDVLFKAEALLPDVILLDLSMPRTDGVAVLRRLRDNPELAAIPTIVLTANAFEKDEAAAHAAGCTLFLTKPIAPVALVAAVRSALVAAPDAAAATAGNAAAPTTAT